MTEKLIHCPACDSDNLDNSVYCCQCGAPMRRGIPARRRRRLWISIVMLSLVFSVIMTMGLQLFNAPRPGHPSGEKPGRAAPADPPLPQQPSRTVSQPQDSAKPSPANRLSSKELQPRTIEQLTVGTVTIVNQQGRTVSEIPAAVVSGSWLALPARACIGGDKWFFRTGNSEKIPIEGGLWGRGDAVGFWRLAGENKFQGPGFATWQQDRPVSLLSLETGSVSEPMTLPPAEVRGAFIYSPLPSPLAAGVFLQNGRVVGWSFGDMLDGAFMWTLGSDTDLLYESYVDDFYTETFAGSREEYFSLALSMESDNTPRMQLQMFTEGFWFSPKLSPENTPPDLRVDVVYPYIIQLVDYLMDRKAYNVIAPLAEEPLLAMIGDAGLMMDVMRAIQVSYGTEAALNFIEGPGADILRTVEEGKKRLYRFHLELYLGWIKKFLDNDEPVRVRQIYTRARNRFKESPELYLLGVELALAEGDWAEAERLLYQKKYPTALRQTRMLLAKRISAIKGRENKLIVRFQPGSSEIPVSVTVNERVDSEFLIDTGASFVTVPYSTVEELGLEDEISPDQVEVQTAGGTVSAGSVTLSSIELQGWVVSDVKALVIDLSNRPGMGLLGLNFLNRFRMDLQADEGILTLEPQ
jgi:clan AA aspartic protease (TIGR02281 family)